MRKIDYSSGRNLLKWAASPPRDYFSAGRAQMVKGGGAGHGAGRFALPDRRPRHRALRLPFPRSAGLHTLPVLRVPHLHRCAQRSIILWSLIPNSCIVAWILRCSFFMVSTTILLNSGVYRLFGTPFGIAKHPTCLDSISYCLTNGVLFIISSSILTVQKEYRKSTGTLL